MEQKRLHISISVVNYYSPKEHLLGLLDSLVAQLEACAQYLTFTSSLYIVDNANERNRLEEICQPYLHKLNIEIISSPENIGYGSGHNLAISRVESEFHLILNPDVIFLGKGLHNAIEYMQSVDAAVAVCPDGVDADGERIFLNKQYPSVCILALRGFAPRWLKEKFSEYLAVYENRQLVLGGSMQNVQIASGCCLLVRTTALKKVLGFRENFFLYFEDFALSMDLNTLGNIVYLPAFSIKHFGGHASKKGLLHIRYFVVSAWKFFKLYGWKFI